MPKDLLLTIYENDKHKLIDQVKALLEAGADPNTITEYQESPLRVASNNGRFDVIKLLLSYGADEPQLQWTPLCHAIVFGDLENLENLITSDVDLEHRDFWERTPFMLAVLAGDLAKIKLIISAGAQTNVFGRCGQTTLMYAIQNDNDKLLKWLIDYGFDIEQGDAYGQRPLSFAAEMSAIKCVKVLIDAGANIFAVDHIPQQAIQVATNIHIVNMLISAGADINKMDSETRATMLGNQYQQAPDVSKSEYKKGRLREFGRSNPTLSKNPFYYAMVKAGASAYHADHAFKAKRSFYTSDPTWCYDRFGISITPLPDGRFIEIAGEHEDSYDPDFCIYNDVFVHDGQGNCKIYTYPEHVFPPTDFHTATLVGDQIYVIGNLSYPSIRKPGYTQVFILDLEDFSMGRIETKGQSPGWISRHDASFDGQSTITITGGKVITEKNGEEDYVTNHTQYSLNLNSLTWTKSPVE